MATLDPEVGQQILPMPERVSQLAARPIISARNVERKGKSIRWKSLVKIVLPLFIQWGFRSESVKP